jgi:hypothetical protein
MEDYPHLADDRLPASLPCASWQPEVVAHARTALQRFCPVGFVVENVSALPSTNKPFCRWYAEFRTSNYLCLPPPGEELKAVSKKLMRYKPVNSKFLSRHLVSPLAIVIVYSRDPCPCANGLDFDKATLRAKMWPTGKGSNESLSDLDINRLFEETVCL